MITMKPNTTPIAAIVVEDIFEVELKELLPFGCALSVLDVGVG